MTTAIFRCVTGTELWPPRAPTQGLASFVTVIRAGSYSLSFSPRHPLNSGDRAYLDSFLLDYSQPIPSPRVCVFLFFFGRGGEELGGGGSRGKMFGKFA